MPNENHRLRLDDEEMAALVHERRRRDVVHPYQRTEPQPEHIGSQNLGGETPLPSWLQPELPVPELVKPDLADPSYGSDPAQPTQGTSDGTGKTERYKGREPEPDSSYTHSNKPRLVDRQLQMAVDYLIGELIRADDL